MQDKTEHDIKFQPATIENIDFAMFKYIESLNISAVSNDGWVKVPVVWLGAEKAHQIKKDREIRDENDMLILPQMVVSRTSTTKSLSRKGIYLNDSAIQDKTQGGEIVIAQEINQEKTSAFANNDAIKKTSGGLNYKTVAKKNNKKVYSFLSIKTPVYLDCDYEIVVRTEYQEQMNDIMQKFYSDPGSLNYFLIKNNGHRYESFYGDDFVTNSNVANFDSEERLFKTVIPIKVLGYIIGDGKNDDRPHLTIKENRVDIKIKERIVKGE